jgi:hypothetical protein
MMDCLLVTPPLTQLNAPYPATTQLLAYIKSKGYIAGQYDLSIDLVDRVFSSEFLDRAFSEVARTHPQHPMLERREEYMRLVEPVKAFLRGESPTLASRICTRRLLPEGPRFRQVGDLDWWFGSLGRTDRAKHLSTLFLLDVADMIRETICPHFGMVRYAERIAMSLPTFEAMETALRRKSNPVDELMVSLLDVKMNALKPKLVGFTIPFPGNLYAALRCGQHIKRFYPGIRVVIGGGYINTELRQLTDPAIFDYVDYITLDDGELPLLRVIERQAEEAVPLTRTFIREGNRVVRENFDAQTIPARELPTPDFSGINPAKYLSLMELTNPMHSLWSNGFWNKMQLSRGCYWAKCSFCDTTLPYIAHYNPNDAVRLADQVERIIGQTGQTGFHFVDEAAPPALLRRLSEEIIGRGLVISWWTNIRFESNFNHELCALMQGAGCIAVTGGLEVASNRILSLINKGVTIEQAARVCHGFKEAGVMVHAYLMYGFPGETEQETIDSLEVVRQLFKHGLLDSAFWHRYAMTCHSETGRSPGRFGVRCAGTPSNPFANNEIPFTDPTPCNHDALGVGLEKAVFNYMHAIGIDDRVNRWFKGRTPVTTVPPNYIRFVLRNK